MNKDLAFKLILLLSLLPLLLNAQQAQKITGLVKDHKESLPAATVLLYKASDSVLVTTGITDNSGKYLLTAPPGSYYVTAASIGYHKVKSAVFKLSSGSDMSLPAITLEESSSQLKEVSITHTKPILERKADRLIFNIEAAPSAAGLNGLEALRKAPGVTVDNNNNISLAGKENVLVMIDGKQTYMSNTEVANLLKTMQSSDMETIEILSNPGSKYEANTTGGIINIKTKKGKAVGFNGTVVAGAGFNSRLTENASVNMNYRKQAYNIFGSYSYSNGKYVEHLYLDRVLGGATNPVYYQQRNRDSSNYNHHNFKIGTDFFLSKNHTIGFLVKGNLNKSSSVSTGRTAIGTSFQDVDSVLKAKGFDRENRHNFTYNINYKGILDTSGQEITIDADYYKVGGNERNIYTNFFYTPEDIFSSNGQLYRAFSPPDIAVKSLKADYSLPFNKKMKMEAGFKISSVRTDNDFKVENGFGDRWVPDASQSNQFKYQEDIQAIYANLNATAGKISVQAGLRAERTRSLGNSVTAALLTERNYFNLFPSLTVSQHFNENNLLNLSLSRKLNRPGYGKLNPFIFYLDQYTYNVGNPYLKPEYSNNAELSYMLRQKYNISAAYTHTSDVITQVLLPDEEKQATYQTNINLATENIFSVTLNFPVMLTRWWNMNNNIVAYHKALQSPEVSGNSVRTSGSTANLYSQQNLTFNKKWSGDVSVMYSTPQIEGLMKIQSLFSTDLGMQYNFRDNLGSLKLGVSDIFHSSTIKLSSKLAGNNFTGSQFGQSTSARITYTRRFGKLTVKSARNRTTGVDDEQKRSGK